MSEFVQLPASLQDLASYNTRVMERLSLPIKIRGLEESRRAGDTYLTSVFPMHDSLIEMRRECDFPQTQIQRDRLAIANQIASEFDIGVLLVRPEMYHARGFVESFLTENEFRIAYSDERHVDSQSYAQLCEIGFRTPEASPAWPTRTIVYLDSPCSIIVFTDPTNRFGEDSLADKIVQQYKGKEGVATPNTIRGSVVLQEAERLGFHKLTDPVLALALDPFTALRNIVELPGRQPHSHLTRDRALLKYNAVSVHVPDRSELVRDLAILNTISQLQEIHESITRP